MKTSTLFYFASALTAITGTVLIWTGVASIIGILFLVGGYFLTLTGIAKRQEEKVRIKEEIREKTVSVHKTKPEPMLAVEPARKLNNHFVKIKPPRFYQQNSQLMPPMRKDTFAKPFSRLTM